MMIPSSRKMDIEDNGPKMNMTLLTIANVCKNTFEGNRDLLEHNSNEYVTTVVL